MTEPLNLKVIMSSNERRGPWVVPSQINARIVMGSL